MAANSVNLYENMYGDFASIAEFAIRQEEFVAEFALSPEGGTHGPSTGVS
jgi:hypothetical protein